jgi:ectoine hydroxylase-related dioxygenase (phytanoyl-CoA dioxygenase family)
MRIQADPRVSAIAEPCGVLGSIADAALGAAARPVRAVLFDKNARNNWAVPWHQDRTIAVCERHEVAGYGPWSRKAGTWHVEPPFEITARMITLRAHLDDCDENNAPLLYVPGSHAFGKLPAASVADFARQRGHVASLAKTGDVWAYATAIVHGSEAARNPSRRRILQIDYSADELPAGLQWAGI